MITMATGIAHDFNNYIAAIMGNNTVMMRSIANEPRARDCAQRIESAAALALHLTDQLATYSARIEFTPSELDPAELLAEVAAATTTALPRGVQLESGVCPHCPTLFADPALLRRLLVNLVTNAAEAMLDLQGRIQVSIGPGQITDATRTFLPPAGTGPWLALTVRDAGQGMTPKVLDHCFDPFFSTKIRGRGMGLPEALGIIRLHNGTISVHSQPGHGTTMTALLPVPDDRALYDAQ